jgi:hypothetical protein
MGRVDHFDKRRRAREQNGGWMPSPFTCALETAAKDLWERYVASYGVLLAAWVGQYSTAERRLSLLIGNVLQRALWHHLPDARIEVEEDDDRRPIAMLFDNGRTAARVPIELTPRSVRIGGTLILLSPPTAGERLLRVLADEIAAFFGPALRRAA